MTFRRFAPLLVLWLFPVVVASLIAAVVVAAVTLGSSFFDGQGSWLTLQILALPLVLAVFFGVRAALAYQPEPAEGVELTAVQHPRLWAEVTDLAALAQTEPPTRIVMVAEMNASVSASSELRELELGLPLLATLTCGELRAVVAHELGHFAGGDTADAAAILRRLVFLHHARDKVGWTWRWFFNAYLRFYAIAAGPSSRAAERRADQLSIQAAGAETSAAAMRSLVRADLNWTVLEEDYLWLFELAGRRASVREAMHSLRTANAEELEPAVDRVLAEERQRASDTHPPVRERIAHFEAAARDGRGGPASTVEATLPAYELLTGGGAYLDSAEGELGVRQFPLSTWNDVIVRGVRQQVNADAERTSALARSHGLGDGSLHSLLSLIDNPDQDPSEITEALIPPVLSAALATGNARVNPSWTTEATFSDADGADLDVAERVGAAVAARDTSDLRAWLAGMGVDVANSHATTDVPQWLAAASHVTGPWEGRRDVHLWTTGVLALPPLDKAIVKANKEQILDSHQHPRLYLARAEGIEAGRQSPQTLWWEEERIVSAQLKQKLRTSLELSLADGTLVAMAMTVQSAFVDSMEDFADSVRILDARRADAMPPGPAQQQPPS